MGNSMLRLMRYTILTMGTFFFWGEILCDQYLISTPLVSILDGTDNYGYNSIEISCQIDTSRKNRDRKEPKKEETKTVRVPKAEPRAEQKEEEKSSDDSSFWDFLSCLSGCADIMSIFPTSEETKPVEGKVPIEFVQEEKPKPDTTNILEMDDMRERAKNSFWYLGTEFSIGGTLSSQGKSEYEFGWMPKITTGIFLSHSIQIEGFAEYGWYAGRPKFDYVTTTNLNSGDIEKVKEIPQKSWLNFSTFGIGARYVFFNPNDWEELHGLGIGCEFRYMSFYEKAELLREEYLNDIQQNSFKHTISQRFDRPTWAINISYFYLPSFLPSWMLEVGLCYNGINKMPTGKLPLSTDWDGLKGQVVFKVGVKFNIFEIK